MNRAAELSLAELLQCLVWFGRSLENPSVAQDHRRVTPTYAEKFIDRLVIEGRVNSLLDLEAWAKLHDLDAEMILDGIEHMCKSMLQSPNQRFPDHADRMALLSQSSQGDK